jgi:hypothetical protein
MRRCKLEPYIKNAFKGASLQMPLPPNIMLSLLQVARQHADGFPATCPHDRHGVEAFENFTLQ